MQVQMETSSVFESFPRTYVSRPDLGDETSFSINDMQLSSVTNHYQFILEGKWFLENIRVN